MLSSIHPLGERTRNANWTLTVVAHVAGATVGGVAAGAAAGVAGVAVRSVVGERAALAVAAGAGLLACLHELGVLRVRLPTRRRQVNEDWLTTYRGWVYGAGYGVQLGLAVATIITSAATHLLLLLAVLTGSPLWGGLVGGVYGFVRGSSVLTGRQITSPERLVAFHRSMARWAAPVRRVAAVVLLGAGLAAAVTVAA